ncbi:FAD/NAD(P)-binding domain-containing protein [Suillus clintonianus]|uniref:FAD/NAD(P)-binding domain-containing protein n=1 Tax=Suillus clintonianus TaxID=1904413 RepID=UPI001B873C20|nr:FAD/NAD(P)-binding domain-containing protein [Suillus clintonianus]KAG2155430.1 FAD/NAD(P)-binding domain-containing protein [Suillus clintonianus]
MPRQLNIIIAGGGISGATAALFLSHLNANIVVLESRPGRTTSIEGGIVMLGPNGMHVLQGLGLAETLHHRPNGIQVPWLHMFESSGGLLGKVPQGSVERYGFASTMITRWDIQEVLLDAMEKKRLSIEWNAKVEDVEELSDGVVVRWREGSVEKERKVDLLVGADGIWSIVRSKMYAALNEPAPKPRYSGLVGVGGVIDTSSVPGLAQYLTLERPVVMVHGRLGFFGMALFDRKEKYAGWWTTYEASDRSKEEWKVPKDQIYGEILRRYSDWAFPIPQIINAAEAVDAAPFVWPVYEVENLQHWCSKSVVLVGDAAHAMPPHSGQGASQGLEDAAYLAYLLQQHQLNPSSDLKDVLTQFQRDRQPRVNEIVTEANRRGDQKREISAFGMFMKKWGMRIVFYFMKESWMDGWFGYKVPGIEDWTNIGQSRQSTS